MTQAYNLSQLANFLNTSGELDASVGLFNALPIANGGTGSSTAANAKAALEVITGPTGSQIVPPGTTAQRDVSPLAGYFRFNLTTGQFEGFDGTNWGAVGGGATGGGSDEVFVENGVTVTTNYTLTTNKNAMSVGPITVDTGITITIPSNQRWVIL